MAILTDGRIQAARVAGMRPDELVRHLNEAAGLHGFEQSDARVENEPPEPQPAETPAGTEALVRLNVSNLVAPEPMVQIEIWRA